jgi:Family of unknown function (DUF6338)
MVPTTAATVAAVLVFVLPGFLFERLRRARRPHRKESVFSEVAVFVMSSAAFSAAGLVVYVALRSWFPHTVLDFGKWIRDGHAYEAGQYGVIARTVLLQVVVSCGLVLLVERSLNQFKNKSFALRAIALFNKFIRHDAARQHVVPHPIEQHVFDFTERKHDEWPVAEIHAKDGHLYVGKLYVHEPGNGIAIAQPMKVFDASGVEKRFNSTNAAVMFKYSEISHVVLRFATDGGTTSEDGVPLRNVAPTDK